MDTDHLDILHDYSVVRYLSVLVIAHALFGEIHTRTQLVNVGGDDFG